MGDYGYVHNCLNCDNGFTGVYICLDITLYTVYMCSFYVNNKFATKRQKKYNKDSI